jgi:hypothetical protein
MKAAIGIISGLLFAVLSISFLPPADINPVRLLGQMTDSIHNVRTLRVRIKALERIEKKFLSAESSIKLQSNPRRLYFFNPDKKLEILYNHGQNNDKALVKPHVFPYLSLFLDPRGNLMRKNQHYTIHELGYDFIGRSVALTLSKDKEGLKNFTYHGKVTKNGYRCYFLEYENKAYSYVDYVVQEKETVNSIASKNCVNDYLVRYNNDLVNDFGYLKKGKVIRIPTLYCKKAVIYIEENLMLPVAISLYDDKGIFENYEYFELVVNKPIKEEEFSRSYKEYHF